MGQGTGIDRDSGEGEPVRNFVFGAYHEEYVLPRNTKRPQVRRRRPRAGGGLGISSSTRADAGGG